jgi:putative hemolysin
MISVDQILSEHYPTLHQRPRIGAAVRSVLRSVLCEEAISDFLRVHKSSRGLPFVDEVLAHMGFRYTTDPNELAHLPLHSRVVIVANHPIGSLDALALLQAVGRIRSDVKVVANRLLMCVEPLHDHLLPVDNLNGRTAKSCLERISEHLANEGAVIIFPAGEVSRMGPRGIRDPKWNRGFLRLASAANAPIVPVHIGGRNSALFYGLSLASRPLSGLLLVREMLQPREKTVTIRFGLPISPVEYGSLPLTTEEKVERFRRHVYRIGQGKPGLFRTQEAIAAPEDRSDLDRVVQELEVLGEVDEGLRLLLYRARPNCPLMREIGRVREVTFRAVGEGTGKSRDVDEYDARYLHIVVWHLGQREIVGAYRLAPVVDILQAQGKSGLYTASLFELHEAMEPYLEQGLELGRSFVAPNYWGRRSLHYLWLGIGAFLARYPAFRYLFGPVSLSASLPRRARDLLTYFYGRFYAGRQDLVTHRQPLVRDSVREAELEKIFVGEDVAANFRILRERLAALGIAVPTLFRQYSELCEPGGATFLGFGIDPLFGDCIDGMVMIDLHRMTDEKFARYIRVHQVSERRAV